VGKCVMWSSVMLALVVSQAGPVKVAAPPFSLVGISPQLGAVLQDRFVSRFGSPDVRRTTFDSVSFGGCCTLRR